MAFNSEPLATLGIGDAVTASTGLYTKCLDIASRFPEDAMLGLALISLAIQWQTGEFGNDITEFDRHVAELLTEARERRDSRLSSLTL